MCFVLSQLNAWISLCLCHYEVSDKSSVSPVGSQLAYIVKLN